jgi:NAD(P)-dependent dehydrogenase (short-subunit alcohol dehydrogenase family)
VVLACRSVERGEALRSELEAQAREGGQAAPKLEVMALDLSSLASVRRFGAAWAARGLPLHALLNNAGLFAMSAPRRETADGVEVHLGTNHLGHFLLTLLLLPSLREGAAAAGRPARVVSVSSRLHLMAALRRDDPGLSTGTFRSLEAYAQSKLAQVLFSAELGRRAGGAGGVRAVALHPGEVGTDVVRTLPGPVQWLYKRLSGAMLLSPAQGAQRLAGGAVVVRARVRGALAVRAAHPAPPPNAPQAPAAPCTASLAPSWTAPSCAAPSTSTRTARRATRARRRATPAPPPGCGIGRRGRRGCSRGRICLPSWHTAPAERGVSHAYLSKYLHGWKK